MGAGTPCANTCGLCKGSSSATGSDSVMHSCAASFVSAFRQLATRNRCYGSRAPRPPLAQLPFGSVCAPLKTPASFTDKSGKLRMYTLAGQTSGDKTTIAEPTDSLRWSRQCLAWLLRDRFCGWNAFRTGSSGQCRSREWTRASVPATQARNAPRPSVSQKAPHPSSHTFSTA